MQSLIAAGRFAPSPSGDLHIGNLRTALLAWLFARSSGRRFLIRMEDLDRNRVAAGAADGQLRDLAMLGLDHDGVVIRQSERTALYAAAITLLTDLGLTYECFCTRREIRDAASAPQADGSAGEGRYPRTCRNLSASEIADRRVAGRAPAIRLRADRTDLTVIDRQVGRYTGPIEDIVLRRNDGSAAYHLAVVVDDAAQGVDQIVRGDDLLPVTPAQAYLATLLDLPVPEYAHVPMALNPAGQRLAKRDGSVTLPDLMALGWTPSDVLALLSTSLDLGVGTPAVLLTRFDPGALPRDPWIVDPSTLLPPRTT